MSTPSTFPSSTMSGKETSGSDATLTPTHSGSGGAKGRALKPSKSPSSTESRRERRRRMQEELNSLKEEDRTLSEDLEIALKLKEARKKVALKRELVKSAQEYQDTDVAFLVDCTSSMEPHIDAVKKDTREFITKLQKRYKCQVRVAFVGYRDHSDGDKRIEKIDFGTVEDFEDFLVNVKAMGGSDVCEDVHGGLEAALSLSWRKKNRCLFHIADYPAHGSRFHDSDIRSNLFKFFNWDEYSDYNESDPRGLRIEDLLNEIKEKKIDYFFGKIRDDTDKMIEEFKSIAGPNIVKCTDVSDVKNFPVAALIEISSTIERGSYTEIEGTVMPSDGLATAVYRRNKEKKEYTLDPRQPVWDEIDWKRVKVDKCEVIDSTDDKLKVHYMLESVEIKMSPDPFAEGGQRIAYYGMQKDLNRHTFFHPMDLKTHDRPSMVLKTLMYSSPNENRDDYLNMVECQAIANILAKEFNQVKPKYAKTVKFLEVKLVELKSVDKMDCNYYTMEDIYPFDKDFVKYNSNSHFVNHEEFTCTLNAFSHWTYERTKHYLMVVDLQGIQLKKDKTYVLTDPAIHCKEARFGRTNIGERGMLRFLSTHTCSRVCKDLNLTRYSYMKNIEVDMGLVSNDGDVEE